MSLGDPTQIEETKVVGHEDQVMSGKSENRLKNLDFSSNSGDLEKVKLKIMCISPSRVPFEESYLEVYAFYTKV
jgi:hypothetical protein